MKCENNILMFHFEDKYVLVIYATLHLWILLNYTQKYAHIATILFCELKSNYRTMCTVIVTK